MCKFCDCTTLSSVCINCMKEDVLVGRKPLSYGSLGSCYICIYHNQFYLLFCDDRETLSDEQITTCPYCGHRLVLTEEQLKLVNPKQPFRSIFDYIKTLEDGSDEWRYAIDYASKYHDTKTVDEMIKHIKKQIEKW